MGFGIASLRLLSLTVLDRPSLAVSPTSASRPRVISRATLQEAAARDAWLQGIQGAQTFLISKALLPDLYRALHTHQPMQEALPSFSLSSLDQHRLSEASVAASPTSLSSTERSAALVTSDGGPSASNSLAQLVERAHEVESASLSDALAGHTQQQRSAARSSSIAPPPAQLPPLTGEQQQLFDLVSANDVSGFEALYSLSPMSIDQPHPAHGGTLLHHAALHASPEMIARLVSLNAHVNARAFNDSTPLHWAAGVGAVGCVRALLEAGADPLARTMTWWRNETGRGSGQTAMHWAAESGWDDVVRLLAAWEPSALVEEDERGRTARHIAQAEAQSRVLSAISALEQDDYVGVRLELMYSGQRMRALHTPPINGAKRDHA